MAFKKSLFSKPSWAAKPSIASKDEEPIFQQNVYEDILEANRRREGKRIAKLREREQRREQERKGQSLDTKTDEEEKTVKKRRISAQPTDSAEAEDDDFDKERSGTDSESDFNQSNRSTNSHIRTTSERKKDSEQSASQVIHDEAKLSHEKMNDHLNSTTKSKAAADEDDDLAIVDVQPKTTKSVSKPKPPPPPDSDSDPEEDEYLKELKMQARANARAKKLHSTTAAMQRQCTPTTDGRSLSTMPPGSAHSDTLTSRDGTTDRETPTPVVPDPNDPILDIVVKSIIPNCKEIRVKRKASQPFDKVLKYFVETNELRPNIAVKVFLTWNHAKLYNATTGRTILATIKQRHGTKEDGTDLAEGKILLEAVTEEIFKHRQQQKEREKLRKENDDEYPTEDASGKHAHTSPVGDTQPNDETVQAKGGEGTIILLRSNDEATLPNMNLRVRPPTTIERIVRGYKRKNGIDMSRQIYLIFDGDRLDDQQTVEDIGFEEGDTVDVRSR